MQMTYFSFYDHDATQSECAHRLIADILKIEKSTDYVMRNVPITSSQFLLRYGNFKQIADSESSNTST